MKSQLLDLEPVKKLLLKHTEHKSNYVQDFYGLPLIIHPEVFNPEYTNVSRLLGQYLKTKTNIKYNCVLDMFCGSGALGLLIANQTKKVLGLDISELAVSCAKGNAIKLGINNAEYRLSDLWNAILESEKFDLIIANPPLLPITPENVLEKAVADSPDMSTTMNFISNCHKYLTPEGKALMAFSNATKVIFKNPLNHIRKIAEDSELKMRVVAKKDVGYEVYRILEFKRR